MNKYSLFWTNPAIIIGNTGRSNHETSVSRVPLPKMLQQSRLETSTIRVDSDHISMRVTGRGDKPRSKQTMAFHLLEVFDYSKIKRTNLVSLRRGVVEGQQTSKAIRVLQQFWLSFKTCLSQIYCLREEFRKACSVLYTGLSNILHEILFKPAGIV